MRRDVFPVVAASAALQGLMAPTHAPTVQQSGALCILLIQRGYRDSTCPDENAAKAGGDRPHPGGMVGEPYGRSVPKKTCQANSDFAIKLNSM